MKLDIESLRTIRDDLVRVVAADDAREAVSRLNEIESESLLVVEQLRKLDQEHWDELRSDIKEVDGEFAKLVASARRVLDSVTAQEDSGPFIFSSRIVEVRCAPYLHLESGAPIIRIVFKTADDQTFISDQDLEDTIGIGVGILKAVAETGRLISDRFGASFHKIELGENVERRLEMIQTETEGILGFYRQQLPSKGS